jgi:hypothetical protein
MKTHLYRLLPFALLFLICSEPTAAQSLRFEQPVLRADGTIEFRLSGGSGNPRRVETSSDLLAWSLLQSLDPSVSTFTDRAGTNRQFYRIIEEGGIAAIQIAGFSPGSALPGTELVIEGVFNLPVNDTDRVVQFGSAFAEARQVSATEWRVTVPSGAGSGPLKLLTATTNIQTAEAFLVLGLAPVTLIPPPETTASDFSIVNTYGGTVLSNGNPSLRVRNDWITLNMAADKTTNRFLYAVSVSSAPITLSVESTAQALVFFSPLLATSDPLMAGRVLEQVRTNAKVIELAAVLAPLFSKPGDLFTNASVQKTYAEAVLSVSGSSAVLAAVELAAQSTRDRVGPMRMRALQSSGVASGDYPLDLEYTSLMNDDDGQALGPYARKMDPGVGPRFPYLNPVDWLALVHKVDTDLAFPNGRFDSRMRGSREVRCRSTRWFPAFYESPVWKRTCLRSDLTR